MKIKMIRSLRFKFIFTFTVFIVLLIASTSLFSLRASIDMASGIFAEEGYVMTQKAADKINGDVFEQIVTSKDMEDPRYAEIQADLLYLKENSGAVYLYSMAPVKNNIYMYVIDGSGTMDSEDFSNLGDEEDVSGYDEAFFRCWETQTSTASKPMDQGEWGWLVSIYTPILNSAGKMVGIVGCDFRAEKLIQGIRKETVRQIITGAAFTLFGILVMLFFLKIIFGRLAAINLMLKEISSGEGDLTHRIKVTREDEIGELATYFNLTIDKIKNLVATIKKQTVNLFNIGNELASNMEQTAAAINQITGNIQSIKGRVINQSASVTETAATMEQVTLNIDKLNGNVEEQTESVAQSSSAIEEMLANIQSVTQTLVRNEENVKELTGASEVGRQGLQEVAADIQEIARESEGILEINAVMQNIASQTNLLSMNAAIEAAHAGEAGKGFAVVADEIRKLAESSGNQSKTISDVLKKIKTAIDKITISTNTVLEKFQAIDDRVRTVSDQETSIRNAMEEQGSGSQQILEAISKLNELTQKVKQGSVEMLEGSKEVISESRNLELVTQEISNGMSEMASGADQINAAVNRVNDFSNENKEHINALVTEVSKFKVE
jgi:methyl-accepting chemotaxis protein